MVYGTWMIYWLELMFFKLHKILQFLYIICIPLI